MMATATMNTITITTITTTTNLVVKWIPPNGTAN